ncbi:uncharacterized protein AMSG_07493 [Thecamonas trahens ATCC 50062]|uniref:Uncharacterized protein n=1 Tax=Thecamonas trahens ATCC 50062 TaxID=461836 RepID=A0A0L0DHL1_THETB|nr:hypothetical protein AMSG_07493 [Thecamonas trahens ATCC 50062]KNC51586.1 hypothetical protein AMSG_07493 [Thecamonas trahens ATCC 50062]|eukprot:XP_013755985.1 hypothetical protein AMSG_07493 [Thecamonas trahens ATCC 50062]
MVAEAQSGGGSGGGGGGGGSSSGMSGGYGEGSGECDKSCAIAIVCSLLGVLVATVGIAVVTQVLCGTKMVRDPSSDASRRARAMGSEDVETGSSAPLSAAEHALHAKYGPPPSYDELTAPSSRKMYAGTWVGHYVEFGKRHAMRMALQLDAEAGQFSGSGTDDLSAYTIRGYYNVDSGKAVFLKRYHSGRYSHGVEYRGRELAHQAHRSASGRADRQL